MRAAKRCLPPGFEYTVVKYAIRTGSVSFIHSPDFDTASEPIVGHSVLVTSDGQIRRRRPAGDPEIYHHKWMFVADDYAGFDVEASKRRSAAWMSLTGIDLRRIGRRSYWEGNVVRRL